MAKIKEILQKPLGFWRKASRKKRLVIILAAVLLIVGGSKALGAAGGGKPQAPDFLYQTVERHDIISTLEGTGTIEPLDSYTVIATVNGDVLSAPFEEGDIIEEGALLYQIDATKAQNSYTQSQLNLQTSADELAKLTIDAPKGGQIISIDCELGDDVKSGQTIIVLEDRANFTLELPFLSNEADSFTVGQSAEVTMTATGEVLSGRVKEISNVQEVSTGGTLTRNVTIAVSNPGGLTEGLSASATIGSTACAGTGTFAYQESEQISAEVNGTVTNIAVKEGDSVSAGQTLITLKSNSIQNSYKNAQINLQNAQEDLDKYTITSPIKGTVIEKNFKAGDEIDSSNAASQMAVIFDMSELEFTMSIDELDISKISVGQKVTVTADALEGQTFEGEVSKISINGTTSGGVTTYPVTVSISECGDLLPGMNINATITLSEARDVLAVPAAALMRGNRVMVKGTAADDSEKDATLPDGYIWREVTVGVNDNSFVEITDGLAEGDEIAINSASMQQGSGTSDNMMMPGGMGGGMPGGMGGGMPGGGGGMPGGGGGMGGGPR